MCVCVSEETVLSWGGHGAPSGKTTSEGRCVVSAEEMAAMKKQLDDINARLDALKSGKRVFTRSEIKAMSAEELESNREELLRANTEGRIRDDTRPIPKPGEWKALGPKKTRELVNEMWKS